jgi:CheY-like chemotaxis protein
MQVRNGFNILLVDDEADMLAVTKLALRNIKVWNIPVKVQTCSSGAEGRAYVQKLGPVPDLALAIIDVVMESDQAGLELCDFIRNELHNYVTPLIVRTGQAGKAPERAVIDKYDISNYITKVEATEERLYTLVKSSCRQFIWSRLVHALSFASNALIPHAHSRDAFLGAMKKMMAGINIDSAGQPLSNVQSHMAYFLGNEVLGGGDYADVAKASGLRKSLEPVAPLMAGPLGEVRVRDGEVLLTLPQSNVALLSRSTFDPQPDFVVKAFLGHLQSVQQLWSLASRS